MHRTPERIRPVGLANDLDGKVRRYLEADGIVGTADWRLSLRLEPLRGRIQIDNREGNRINPSRRNARRNGGGGEGWRLDRDTSCLEPLRCLTIADLLIRRRSVVAAIDRSGVFAVENHILTAGSNPRAMAAQERPRSLKLRVGGVDRSRGFRHPYVHVVEPAHDFARTGTTRRDEGQHHTDDRRAGERGADDTRHRYRILG